MDKPCVEVLDKGFLRLELTAGDDLLVVNAARMSFLQKSLELTEKEERLIGFLMRNRHGTPFEMVEFWWHVKCPITVAREWFRHRIACLPGDAEIMCVQPNGNVYSRTIEHLYRTHCGIMLPERWIKNGRGRHRTGARKKVPAQRARTWKGNRALRVLGENGFTVGSMADIWQAGIKPLYLLETKDGRKLRASADHRVLTPEGWARIHELSATDAVIRMGRVAVQDNTIPRRLRLAIQQWATLQRRKVIGQGANCYLCGKFFWEEDLHLDHVVPVLENIARALDISNLAPVCLECHREKTNREQPRGKRSEIGTRADRLAHKPELVAEEMTYDIEMAGPNHNYLANQLVVHNSYNEMSGRYRELPKEFYLPDPENVRTQVGKPGSYSFEPMSSDAATTTRLVMAAAYDAAWQTYQGLLHMGVAKELARSVLPVGIYTEFMFKCNFRSLMNFISLRSAETAMYEIRCYAQAMAKIVANVIPVSWKKFEENGRVCP